MKKINKINFGFLFVFAAVASIVFMPACKKTVTSTPVITGVLNYAASPSDTALTGLIPNAQWVVITGKNLQGALAITFNGVQATFNAALLAPNSAVVQIPAIVFSSIDTNKLNIIQYATAGGVATFSFKLMPAVPVITAISNVFANPGDSVFLSGTNFFLVKSLSYGGTNITSFAPNTYGTSVGFVMPNPAPTSGNVILTTKSGTVTVAGKIVVDP